MKNADDRSVKEIGLKTVFVFIINAIFLLFFITSVTITFKAGQFFASVCYLLLSILTLIPHHYFRVTQALKYVLLIILFVVVAGINGSGKPPVEQKYEYFDLGKTFNLTFGKKTFSMMVKETKQDTKMIASGKEVTTSGYFLVVVADITNLGSEAVDFKLEKDPILKDSQNRSYTLYGAKIAQGKLQPSVAKEFSYVFEIPKDSTVLKFIIKDKTDITKSIDLKK